GWRPVLLGTQGCLGSKVTGFGPAAPGTGRKSPPIPIHAVWFMEKSGAVVLCCAVTSAASAAQTMPVKTPPARTFAEVNLRIAPSPLASLVPPSLRQMQSMEVARARFRTARHVGLGEAVAAIGHGELAVAADRSLDPMS